MRRKFVSMLLAVCLVVSSFISPDTAAGAEGQGDFKAAEDYAEDDVVHGDGVTEPLSKLLTMSDYQKWGPNWTDDWASLQVQLADILAGARSGGASPDYLLFGGDTSCLDSADTSGTGQDQVLSILRGAWPNLTEEKCVIIQGNHDPAATKGMASTGPYYFRDFIIYVVNEDDFPTKQGSESVLPGIVATANDLKAWLDDRVEKKETRPIFIASHTGLHYDIDRQDGNNQYAYVVYDAINEAAKQLDVVFFFGHNHTNGDEQVGGSLTLYQKGDKLNICTEKSIANRSGTPSTINFTYMNYGYVGYIGPIDNNPSDFEATDELTMSQLSIYNDRIDVVRYNKDGILENYNRTINRDHASGSQTAVKKHEVYYEARGGELPVTTEEICEGKYIINRKAPTRSGYMFKYYEDDEGNRYQPGDEINVVSDVTLKARWEKLSQAQGEQRYVLTDTINPGKKYILVWNSEIKGNAGTKYALTAGESGVTVTTLDSSCFSNNDSVINISGSSTGSYLWDIIWNQGVNEARGYVLQNVGTKKYLCNSGTAISLGTDPVNAFKEYAWVYRDYNGYQQFAMYNNNDRYIRYSVGGRNVKLGTTATSTDVNNSNVYLYELYEPDNYVWQLTDRLESNEQYMIANAGEEGKANVMTVSARTFGQAEVTIKTGADNVKYIERTAAYNDVAVWHPYEVAGNTFWLDSWNNPSDSEVLWLDSSALKMTSNHADSRYYFRFTYQNGELSAYQGLSGTANKRSIVYSNGFTVGTGSKVYLFKRVYKSDASSGDDDKADNSAAKAELNNMIADAERAYSEFGGEALKAAIESAKAALEREDASEDDIYDAMSAIRKGIKKAKEEYDPTQGGEIENTEPPAKVTGVSAVSAGTAKIKISWKKTAKADGYLVYRYDSRGKKWKCIKTISKGSVISYTNSKLTSGTAYKYRVCAYVNADGKKLEGAVSKTVTAATKPAKCSLKKTTAKKKAITLKWKKTTGSGYEITYAQKKNFSGAKTIKVSGASKTSYTIRKLKSKKTYYVKVRAYTKVGKKIIRGSYSARKTVKTK